MARLSLIRNLAMRFLPHPMSSWRTMLTAHRARQTFGIRPARKTSVSSETPKYTLATRKEGRPNLGDGKGCCRERVGQDVLVSVVRVYLKKKKEQKKKV